MNDDKNIEDLYLQKKILEAAAAANVNINDQKTLNMLLFVAKQCMPDVFATIIKEYEERGSI